MDIYAKLNQMIDYIEKQIDKELSYKELSKILGVNEYTLQSVFYLLGNISLSNYIRFRRLSKAAYDLCHTSLKVIDVAFKYQYSNPTSFSRAFTKFHGVKPIEVKKGAKKVAEYPKLHFASPLPSSHKIAYEVIEREEMHLYGKKVQTTHQSIQKDAPLFCRYMKEKYGSYSYGMVVYENRFESDKYEYWVLYLQKIKGFTEYILPKNKWLLFSVPSQNSLDIQKASTMFYEEFLPGSNYNISPLPELESYHDGQTDFLVPIED